MSTEATQLAQRAGISYRQLDHWTRRGYVRANTPGSGHPRTWTDREAVVCVVMARLVAAGLQPDAAADVARRAVRRPASDNRYTLTGGVWVEITDIPLA